MTQVHPITIGTRTGVVVYLDDTWTPVAPEDATHAKVLFDDGGVSFYRVDPMTKTPPPQDDGA